ncbi:MAG: acetoin dehydrogenase dihydrolipoyllysine-residue acetyltransferase subunit [Deltaproteobacteria bacterium]|nr:acetoin dehydrogenase dihydrolipoyllysine-residue acetyltransferase subunit [Deltaproteobacteria bacterium]
MGEMIKVTMPKWGLSMVKGTVNDWVVEEGEEVEKGQELVEIETDKIANVLESPGEGVLYRIVAQPGEVLPVSALLGVITQGEVDEAELEGYIVEAQAAAAADETPDPLTINRSLDWEGLTIRYLDSEEGERPLICLHGFGGDKNNWQFNLAALAPNRRVLAPDFPSHGDSTVSAEHSSPLAYAKMVSAMIDQLELGQVDLVGHSMGGLVALLVARESPAKVGALTLLAPAGIGAEINAGYVDGFATANSRNGLKSLAPQLFADKEMVSRQMVADLLKYKRLDGVEEALVQLAKKLHSGGKQIEDLSSVAQSVPTKIFWGKVDEILPVSNCAQLSGGDVEQLECGHMAHMEAAEVINKHLGG